MTSGDLIYFITDATLYLHRLAPLIAGFATHWIFPLNEIVIMVKLSLSLTGTAKYEVAALCSTDMKLLETLMYIMHVSSA